MNDRRTAERPGGAEDIASAVAMLLEARRVDDALARVQAGLAEHPADPGLLAAHARVRSALGEPVAKRRAAEALLAAAPDDAYGMLVLAEVQLDQGDRLASQEVSERLAALHPEWPPAHVQLAAALAAAPDARRRVGGVAARLDRAIELEPENAEHYRWAAAILLGLRAKRRARDLAERGLAVDPMHIELQTLRALSGRDAEAETLAAVARGLAEDPADRSRARALSDGAWGAAQAMPAGVVLVGLLVVLAHSAFFPLPAWLDASAVMPAISVGGVVLWFGGLLRARRALPPGALRRALGRTRWSWIGYVPSTLGLLVLLGGAIELIGRSDPERLRTDGEELSGVMALFTVVAFLALLGSVVLVLAASAARRRAGLFRTDCDDDLHPAADAVEATRSSLGVATAVAASATVFGGAVLLLGTPAGAAAAPTVLALALAFAAPGVLRLVLALGTARRVGGARRAARWWAVVATAVAVLAPTAVFAILTLQL